ARLNQCRLKPPYFVWDLRGRDAVTRDVIQVIAHDVNLAPGHSRGDAHSFKSDFLTRAVAHAPARVKQMSNNASSAWSTQRSHRSHESRATDETNGANQSSLKPALINASMSSIALSASW